MVFIRYTELITLSFVALCSFYVFHGAFHTSARRAVAVSPTAWEVVVGGSFEDQSHPYSSCIPHLAHCLAVDNQRRPAGDVFHNSILTSSRKFLAWFPVKVEHLEMFLESYTFADHFGRLL